MGGIDTGIVLRNTVVFGIGNSVSQRRSLSSLVICLGSVCSD